MALRKKTILIVDDEESIRLITSQYLTFAGFRTVVAKDYDEAMEIVKKEPVRLVLADVMMPGPTCGAIIIGLAIGIIGLAIGIIGSNGKNIVAPTNLTPSMVTVLLSSTWRFGRSLTVSARALRVVVKSASQRSWLPMV